MKNRILCSAAILCFLPVLLLHPPRQERPETWVVAEVYNVVDCDTVDAHVLLPWGVTLREQRIRFADFDAWESWRSRPGVTDQEIELGLRATEALEELLAEASTVWLQPADRNRTWEPGRDNFGRLLGAALLELEDGSFLRLKDWAEAGGHERSVR